MSPLPSFVETADRYAADVISGRQVACKWIRLACQRYLDDKARTGQPGWPYRFDEAAGNRVCKFVSMCPHTKGQWAAKHETIKLESWQTWVLVNAFGFLGEDGLRRFRQVMCMIPRKNGKSCLSAAVGLYMLCCDKEYSAEVYSGAGSEKQSWEVFRPAQEMVRKNPALAQHFGVQVNARSLYRPVDGSRFETLIGAPGDGASPSAAIIDEFHEHDTPNLLNTMKTGMGARIQPLLWIISTAGDNLAGPCFDHIQTGRKILDKAVTDERILYIEYGIDDDTDWTTPAALRMANPNFGVSVYEDFLLAAQRAAIRNTRDQGAFQTKHLNRWVNTRAAYFNMQSWNSLCFDKNLDISQFKTRKCWIGMDLAARSDICALQIVFSLDNGEYATFGRYYLPTDQIHAAGKDYYRAWMLDDKLIGTPGSMTDISQVYDDIVEIRKTYDVQSIVFDPSQATWLMGRLMDDGAPVLEFRQWAGNYSEPMRHVDGLIKSGKLKHNAAPNDPLSWMLSNVENKTNNKDQDFPNKSRPENKIDAACALIMCFSQAIKFAETGSVYESRGILVW